MWLSVTNYVWTFTVFEILADALRWRKGEE
jgi:hypothetical protein